MNKFTKCIDLILRTVVKGSSYIYYLSKDVCPPGYVHTSGKILDHKELFNMIDASLDMWLTAGRFNDKFETELANFLGVKHVMTVNSGSSANLIAISALTSSKLGDKRLKPDDEVITVAAGFPTTINPIIQNKLIPVFVDVDLGTYNINVEQIEEAITERTKAVFVAHTLGNPFNVEKVLEICDKHGLWLIEDNCDALGAQYNGKYTGTFGHIATLSFYPAHHITMGEGGAILTNDTELYHITKSFRDWGRDCFCPPGEDNTCKSRFGYKLGNLPRGYDHKYTYSHLGYNFKLTDWQAAIGLAQLEKLPAFVEARNKNFNLLYNGLKDLKEYLILPEATENSAPSWFGFLITLKESSKYNKNDLIKFLEDNRVGTRHLFAGNMLKQPAFVDNHIKIRIRKSLMLYSSRLYEKYYNMLPNTDTIMNNSFWIGVWPGISKKEIMYVISIFKKFFEEETREYTFNWWNRIFRKKHS